MAQGSGALVRMGVLDTTPWLSPLKAIHFTCTKRNHPRSSGLGSGIPMKKTLVFVSRERKCITGACFRGSLLDFCPVSFLRRRRQSEHRYPQLAGPLAAPFHETSQVCNRNTVLRFASLSGGFLFFLSTCPSAQFSFFLSRREQEVAENRYLNIRSPHPASGTGTLVPNKSFSKGVRIGQSLSHSSVSHSC